MVDETTKSKKDELQASGQASKSEGGSSSKDKVTLSKSDHEKLVNDAKTAAGRMKTITELTSERDSLKQQLQTVNSRLDELEKTRNEERLAEARGDPAKLTAYQADLELSKREREIREKEHDFARREEQLKADREQFDKDSNTVNLAYTAAKHGLKTEDLEELGITDPDILEKVAGKIAAGKGTEDTSKDEGEGEKEEWTPDSHDGVGGDKKEPSEQERLKERYPSMYK